MIRQREIRAAPPAAVVGAPPAQPEAKAADVAPPAPEVPVAPENDAAPETAEFDTASSPAASLETPAATPRPFTEVYVAEAAERISGPTQTRAFTREELLEALRNSDLRADDPASRSALARLLHRLADRLG
jgi:hypothetical protein